MAAGCRNKAADLRHQGNQRILAHVGRFARHVGAGDDEHAVFGFVQRGIVWHKQTAFQHLLNHRVAALGNRKHIAVIHRGFYIVVLHRRFRKGSQNIQLGYRKGRALDAQQLGGDGFQQVGKQLHAVAQLLVGPPAAVLHIEQRHQVLLLFFHHAYEVLKLAAYRRACAQKVVAAYAHTIAARVLYVLAVVPRCECGALCGLDIHKLYILVGGGGAPVDVFLIARHIYAVVHQSLVVAVQLVVLNVDLLWGGCCDGSNRGHCRNCCEPHLM